MGNSNWITKPLASKHNDNDHCTDIVLLFEENVVHVSKYVTKGITNEVSEVIEGLDLMSITLT
jgi:hypothetical protein